MKITIDNIEDLFGRNEISYFEEKYSTGAEFVDLCKDKDLDDEVLHTIYYEYITEEKDREAYLERMNIKNSSSYFSSSNLESACSVAASDKVEYSKDIFYSKNIMTSEGVFCSYDIFNSKEISFSSNVRDSQNILSGKNITESTNVASSMEVVKSSSIYRSENITGSSIVLFIHNLNSCTFVSRCSNSNGLLFCHNVDNANLMLFNKPIKFSLYSKILREFSERFKKENTYIMTPMTIKHGQPRSQLENFDLRKHFETLSDEFWEWVKVLPNYNNKIMYDITYINSFLENKDLKS